jgi:drug/metabolite transporter (DMT)-like permease
MQFSGLLAAMLSTALGGTAIGATRYLAGHIDPITLGAVRFAGGIALLLPIALVRGERWPPRRDWPAVTALGLLFFGLFPVLFNISLIYTTAARGALALSTLPLLTIVAGALLGIERPTLPKTLGVLIAFAGVAIALASSLDLAPAGAWRGDLLMVAGALCMALYGVWARPFITRSGAISFTVAGMAVGAVCLIAISAWQGGFRGLAALRANEWMALAYLAIVCGAFIFFLWAYALGRTTPTLVAISVAINPITASLVGVLLLSEEISPALIVGLVAVLTGIAVASGLLRLPIPARG